MSSTHSLIKALTTVDLEVKFRAYLDFAHFIDSASALGQTLQKNVDSSVPFTPRQTVVEYAADLSHPQILRELSSAFSVWQTAFKKCSLGSVTVTAKDGSIVFCTSESVRKAYLISKADKAKKEKCNSLCKPGVSDDPRLIGNFIVVI